VSTDQTHSGPANATLTRATWCPVLFASRLGRLDLSKLQANWDLSTVRFRVHRNHAFEHAASVMPPWMAFWSASPEFIYSDYDDSLSFDIDTKEQVDIELIWVDIQRYDGKFSADELVDWLAGRILALRALSDAPILVIPTSGEDSFVDRLSEKTSDVAGVRVGDARQILNALGAKAFDMRAAKFTGTRLSDAASIQLAREVACRWVPALLRPRIKAVAVDLDHTLYRGVLGEDRHNVELTDAHKSLQQFVRGLRDQGIFLALVSRNEDEDVQELFAARKDFPLQYEDFDVTQVHWGSKADSLDQVAKQLRIGTDAILFVDDNPGELAEISMRLPTQTLHAAEDASVTLCGLQYYPALWAWDRSETDLLRVKDLRADQERVRLADTSSDPYEYLKSLQVALEIDITPNLHRQRIWELSQKTNQFNMTLSRYSELDVSKMLDSEDYSLATLRLSDRLSDSGLIGMIVGRKEADTMHVLEMAISCRALGRKLEDFMIGHALTAMQQQLGCEHVVVHHQEGPRNAPARNWLATFSGESLENQTVPVTQSLQRVAKTECPITIQTITSNR